MSASLQYPPPHQIEITDEQLQQASAQPLKIDFWSMPKTEEENAVWLREAMKKCEALGISPELLRAPTPLHTFQASYGFGYGRTFRALADRWIAMTERVLNRAWYRLTNADKIKQRKLNNRRKKQRRARTGRRG